jgi:2-dehydropantoate 2-reductase
VIARGAQLAAIRASGLTIRAPNETFSVAIQAASPAELGPQDIVLVTVKAPALPAIAAGIAPLLGPATKVVFVLNGIPWWYLGDTSLAECDPGDAVRRAVGLGRTIGAVVNSACTVIEPGVIRVGNARSKLIIGTPDDREVPELAALAAALEQPGYACEIAPNIRNAVWTKLLGNLATGHLAVLGAAPPHDVFADPVIQAACRTVYAEGFAIAASYGCAPVVDVEAQLRGLQKMTHRPSILQDLQLGRPMEIDGIFCSTQHLARMAGVQTPMLDILVALMKVRARAAGLYPGSAV